MKLYGTPPTRALRAIWLLNELNLDCEIIEVDITKGEHLTPEFLAINPAGRVPVLVDDDLTLTESSAIPLYLAQKRPDCRLIPADAKQRALMFQWIFFLVSEIEQPLWRIAKNTSIYAEQDRMPQDVAMAGKECRKMLQVLENHLQGRRYLLGDELSVADFNAAYVLDWAHEAKMLTDTPRLREYWEHMYQRPAAPTTIAAALSS